MMHAPCLVSVQSFGSIACRIWILQSLGYRTLVCSGSHVPPRNFLCLPGNVDVSAAAVSDAECLLLLLSLAEALASTAPSLVCPWIGAVNRPCIEVGQPGGRLACLASLGCLAFGFLFIDMCTNYVGYGNLAVA